MSSVKKILCPIDLSENSLAALELATTIASGHDATLVFIYVAPQWLPDEAMFGSDYIRTTVEEDKNTFEALRPLDSSIDYNHIFVFGNPGPEIVKHAKDCDMVVMSTHGHGGVMRFLMGSVAQYVIRNATCSVVTLRNSKIEPKAADNDPQLRHFVTEIMRHVRPIRSFDKMETITAELERANQSGAPVIDDSGCCIGILTKTDIQKYHELQARFARRDETVIDEMFEIDEFGQRRASNLDFDQVRRHMTAPVVTISNSEACQKARELFEANSTIHHLIVIDESDRPIGIVGTEDLKKCKTVPSEAQSE